MQFENIRANTKNDHRHINYHPEIDGLRAIAVLAVLVFHAFPSVLPGGFAGVDVFFVISGYLITSILNKEMQEDRYSIAEFYRRRVDRLFPALALMLACVYAFGWFTLFADEYMQLGKQMAGGAAFSANIVLFSETGYFNAAAATKPLLHLWSLGVEEQFYLAFPIVLFLAFRLRINLLATAAALLLVSFALNMVSIRTDIERTFYLPQYRHWEILAGAVLALLASRKDQHHGSISMLYTALSAVGFALIGYSMLMLTEKMPFPGWRAALPVAGTVLIIAAAHRSWINAKVLSSRLMVAVGLVSFPLYLWHWPLLSIAHVINGDVPPIWVRALLLLAATVLSSLTYLVIERPLKRIKSWRFKTIPLIIAMTAIGVTGLATYQNRGVETRDNIEVAKAVQAQLNGALWQYTNNDTCMNKYPFNPKKKPGWWFCMLTQNSEPDVLLLGNSYANHLYPGISESPALRRLNILSIGISDVTRGVNRSEPTDAFADYQAQFINNIIATSSNMKYVIISGLNPNPTTEYINALSERIGFIERHGKRVIIFAPHVLLKANIKACFPRPLKAPDENCSSDLSEVERIRSEFLVLSSTISKAHPEVQYFDPNSLICSDTGCSSIRNGMPIYRDQYKHLSVYASLQLGGLFAAWASIHAPWFVKDI
ncbi:acyltransferase family protein [Pseudomonas guariconensis]|uniref:acyltransferase family protein n=1 Tax=Pseudomonas guariconensis TaxID=1288410 RepID=UPI0018D633B5|nr:acyltransferase family protein [Pseudomonas guariconensis]MBH3360773.1 acyltransferase [Pseudomonas guariconensis]